MIIQFLHISGKTYKLDMEANATIQQTKVALVYMYQLNFPALEFIYNTRVLNDNEKLSQIGYISTTYIIFSEPIDEPEELPDFFGETPQVCKFSRSDELDIENLENLSQQSNFNPFQNIEKNENDILELSTPIYFTESNSYRTILPSNSDCMSDSNSEFQRNYQKELQLLAKPFYPVSGINLKIKEISKIPLTTKPQCPDIENSQIQTDNPEQQIVDKQCQSRHYTFEQFRNVGVENNTIHETIDINCPSFIKNISIKKNGFDPNDVNLDDEEYF